jgi:hypothetical protein
MTHESTGLVAITDMSWLTFGGSGIQINMKTGEVNIPDDLTLTEAAQKFWNAVRQIGRNQ